ncbi:MAG: SDR family oxidoreductase [Christensenellaceae bacterium]|nr:SDR family oxidoreductase [Christensenellaceae bacterium]
MFFNKNYDFANYNTDNIFIRKRKPVPDRFKDKVAIVTGGSTGIGRSIVEELVREGANVTFTGRKAETANLFIEDLKKEGLENKVLYLQGDMGSEEFCHYVVDKTVEYWGKLNYLVNNAFPFVMKGREVTTDDWMFGFTNGILNYARMIDNSAKEMIKIGGGAIVNVSSISGHIAQSMWIYNTLKGGVGMMTKAAALNYARDNIRINAMSPAGIWTRVTTRGMAEPDVSPEDRAKRAFGSSRETMLLRLGEPVECASTVLFLLSDDASYVTGSEYMVDGGFLTMGSEGSIERDMKVLSHRDEFKKYVKARPWQDDPHILAEKLRKENK